MSESGSPLSRGEMNRLLNERVDALLTEAVQLEFDLDSVDELVRRRSRQYRRKWNRDE